MYLNVYIKLNIIKVLESYPIFLEYDISYSVKNETKFINKNKPV